MKTKDLVLQAFIAALYVALSYMLAPFTYGPIQVRVAEALLILVLISPKHSIGIIIGCFITNLGSPLGLIDIIFGTLATTLTCVAMAYTKNKYVALLWPSVINGIIVGIILTYAVYGELTLIMNIASVFIGEFVATFIPGFIMMKPVVNNPKIKEYFG